MSSTGTRKGTRFQSQHFHCRRFLDSVLDKTLLRSDLHLNLNLLTSTLAVSEGCFHGENIIVIRYFRAVVTTLLYNGTTFKPSHTWIHGTLKIYLYIMYIVHTFKEVPRPHLLPIQVSHAPYSLTLVIHRRTLAVILIDLSKPIFLTFSLRC